MRVSVRYLRPSAVLYIRSTGPYEQSANAAWERMRTWLDSQDMTSLPGRGIGYIRDNPERTGPFLRRYDACIDIVPGLDTDYHAGVGRQTLPSGTFAVYEHVGAHSELRDAFNVMKNSAIPQRGFKIDGARAFLEIYLDDPKLVPVAQCRTELCVPIMASALGSNLTTAPIELAGAA
jgi:AraC family transcriptional regulator